MTRTPNYIRDYNRRSYHNAPATLADALSKNIEILNKLDEIIEDCELFATYAFEDGMYDGCPVEYWNAKIEAYQRARQMIEGRLFPMYGPLNNWKG